MKSSPMYDTKIWITLKHSCFFLSILWRCHISKNKVFSDVDLGPHAEHIRKMIMGNDPRNDHEYEVILIYIDTDG
ncbi:hypothetical protein IW22_16725 [Chryseobacterium sp. JM1]|nr:hypothetical protein IW22_16725 [Chryseobacterium sp. JM1]